MQTTRVDSICESKLGQLDTNLAHMEHLVQEAARRGGSIRCASSCHLGIHVQLTPRGI